MHPTEDTFAAPSTVDLSINGHTVRTVSREEAEKLKPAIAEASQLSAFFSGLHVLTSGLSAAVLLGPSYVQEVLETISETEEILREPRDPATTAPDRLGVVLSLLAYLKERAAVLQAISEAASPTAPKH